MKKLTTFLTACAIIASLFPAIAYADDIKVYLDGEQLRFEVQPVIIDGTTFVPMRTIFEALGVEVFWDGDTQTVIARCPGILIVLPIGEYTIYRNTIPLDISTPAYISNGNTLIPLRLVSEYIGCEVEWVDTTQSIHINTTDKIKELYYNQGIYYVGEAAEAENAYLDGLEQHAYTYEGYGALYNLSDNSTICMGYFDNGNMVLGTLYNNDGSMYSGEFKDGKYSGHGTYYFSSGDIYDGHFENGKANGQGVYFWADGTVYEGEFIDNQPSGNGAYTHI